MNDVSLHKERFIDTLQHNVNINLQIYTIEPIQLHSGEYKSILMVYTITVSVRSMDWIWLGMVGLLLPISFLFQKKEREADDKGKAIELTIQQSIFNQARIICCYQ